MGFRSNPVGLFMRTLLSVLLCLASMLLPSLASCAPLPVPEGTVILSVSGNLTETNATGRADFDLAMLQSYPQYELEMETPWTDGVQHFEGVALKELLQALGAAGNTLRAVALNDYQVTINLDELRDVQVLIAIKLNGNHMRVRDKGPLWIVYPMDSFSAADLPRHESNMVWQLRSLEIR